MQTVLVVLLNSPPQVWLIIFAQIYRHSTEINRSAASFWSVLLLDVRRSKSGFLCKQALYEGEVIGIRHYKQVNSSNKQSKSALIQCSLMPVIAALVDIRTLLEPAFNDYTDTVINSPIYFLFECVFNLFSTCHNPLAYHSLPAPDSSSHFRNILFIQHRTRCQPFCFAFQHFASWLSLPPEPHLVDLCDSQLHRNKSSNLAPALVIIALSLYLSVSLIHFLSVDFSPTHFALLFFVSFFFFACESR